MPSKLNSEFNYRYQVLGDTPWEKIKILKGFLEGRVRAAVLEEVSHIKHAAKKAKLAHLKATCAPEFEQLELHAEIIAHGGIMFRGSLTTCRSTVVSKNVVRLGR